MSSMQQPVTPRTWLATLDESPNGLDDPKNVLHVRWSVCALVVHWCHPFIRPPIQ